MSSITIIVTTISILVLSLVVFVVIKGSVNKRKAICKKNEWTTIISNFGTGTPKTWNISFKTKNGEPLKGKYIEKRYFWIFPDEVNQGELKETMQFNRKWINAIYKLNIYAESDIEVEII